MAHRNTGTARTDECYGHYRQNFYIVKAYKL
jgi:hypothetical protein